ncbi:MAG TPA: glycosyltransferase family 2 protein [Pyrinomonadaceae bacterium]|nr:glycosyltransferase family 2 protein [Pyrinomonadaceae bacterium]
MSVQTTGSQLTEVSETFKLDAAETVSVVIPCYNEERFIGKALDQLADQCESDCYEIIVVDGLSEDRSRAVIDEFRMRRPDVSVLLVDNPARNIPTALNLGIAAARGNIIARMDAHAVPSQGYIRRCVEVLHSGTVGAVGMPCMVRAGADTLIARAIAAAVSHPFGIGDAKYRLGSGGPAQEAVDTVAFACFRKSLWKELGGYDESLHTNEDYDFNYRVRRSGRQVILDRAGHCDYFARPTLKTLASQYNRYGGWKAEMIRLHPRSTKLRHLVAPLFVASIVVLGATGIFWKVAWWVLFVEVVTYLICALLAGWRASKKFSDGLRMVAVMPVVFATIHLTWGANFVFRLLMPSR